MSNIDIKMVVTDLDGTFLNHDRTISDDAVATIALLKKNNIPFTFITGRPPYAVERFMQRVNIDQPIVCCNGAVVVKKGKVLIQHSFSLEPLKSIMCRAAELGLTVLVYAQGIEHTLSRSQWTIEREKTGHIFPLFQFENFSNITVEKVNIISDGQNHLFELLIAEIQSFGIHYSVTLYGKTGCEIVAKNITKATGLIDLCTLCNILPEHVLAIGDNENDHPMLHLAGIGAAVANATESTLLIADYQCKQTYTQGVLEAIYKFVLMEDK